MNCMGLSLIFATHGTIYLNDRRIARDPTKKALFVGILLLLGLPARGVKPRSACYETRIFGGGEDRMIRLQKA